MDRIQSSLEEIRKVRAIRKAFKTVKVRQKDNICKIKDLPEKKDRLRKEREQCVGNRELIGEAIKNLEGNGFKVILAGTRADAISGILELVGEERTIVKGKSNVTKEIDLTHELGSRGIEVIETDIGDRVLQLTSESPSHPTGPICHLTARDISKSLSGYFSRELDEGPEGLVGLIKDDISRYLSKAGIGITGANAIAAQEGAVFLIHNEGNLLEVMMRPGKHIIVTGIDKIYTDLDEVLNMGRLQTYYATGSIIPSFMNILGGPSKTADIEKRLINGVHGPREIYLVLVDNMRTEIMGNGFKELLYCIGCGSCLLHCPVYNVQGNKFGKGEKLGGRGVVHSALLNGGDAEDKLFSCVSCGRCKKNCPVSLDIPGIMQEMRKGYPGRNGFVESHLKFIHDAARYELLLLADRFLNSR